MTDETTQDAPKRSAKALRMERQADGIERNAARFRKADQLNAASRADALAATLRERAASIRAGKGDPRYPNGEQKEQAA